MKNALLLLCICLLLGTACKKSGCGMMVRTTKGYLNYQNPAGDGIGYWYTGEGNPSILLSDDFKKSEYQQYINVYTEIEYIDSGKLGCLPRGLAGGCSGEYPLIHVISFKKL